MRKIEKTPGRRFYKVFYGKCLYCVTWTLEKAAKEV